MSLAKKQGLKIAAEDFSPLTSYSKSALRILYFTESMTSLRARMCVHVCMCACVRVVFQLFIKLDRDFHTYELCSHGYFGWCVLDPCHFLFLACLVELR